MILLEGMDKLSRRGDKMFEEFKPTKQEYERVGIKPVFPLPPGKVVSPVLDPVFKNLANDIHNRRFLAKIISLVTDIDYNYLMDNIVFSSNVIQDGSAFVHHNEHLLSLPTFGRKPFIIDISWASFLSPATN